LIKEEKAEPKIAIVEDLRDVAQAVGKLVEVLGYQSPTIFEDGSSIVRAISSSEESFDAVIVDYRLSNELDGIQTAKLIRKNKNDTRIVMMSAYDFVKEKADNLGVPFLRKPFSKEQLEKVLHEMFPTTLDD
jgi:DNA-binding NtrC family response regulator